MKVATTRPANWDRDVAEPLYPDAVVRMAEMLHDLTGWDFPEIPTDREYVSRLWAEDWDSAEDSTYDDL